MKRVITLKAKYEGQCPDGIQVSFEAKPIDLAPVLDKVESLDLDHADKAMMFSALEQAAVDTLDTILVRNLIVR